MQTFLVLKSVFNRLIAAKILVLTRPVHYFERSAENLWIMQETVPYVRIPAAINKMIRRCTHNAEIIRILRDYSTNLIPAAVEAVKRGRIEVLKLLGLEDPGLLRCAILNYKLPIVQYLWRGLELTPDTLNHISYSLAHGPDIYLFFRKLYPVQINRMRPMIYVNYRSIDSVRLLILHHHGILESNIFQCSILRTGNIRMIQMVWHAADYPKVSVLTAAALCKNRSVIKYLMSVKSLLPWEHIPMLEFYGNTVMLHGRYINPDNLITSLIREGSKPLLARLLRNGAKPDMEYFCRTYIPKFAVHKIVWDWAIQNYVGSAAFWKRAAEFSMKKAIKYKNIKIYYYAVRMRKKIE
jgi:hypothetical protein